MSQREPYVFYCEGGCQKYVLVNMNLALEGEHVMICPSCEHQHYRKVEKGQITDIRHGQGNRVDTIEPMPSAVFESREAAVAALGLTTGKKRNSFLNRIWLRKAQEEAWKR